MIDRKTVVAAVEAAGFSHTIAHSFGYIFESRHGEKFEVFNGKPEFEDPTTGERVSLALKRSPYYKSEIAEISYTEADGEITFRASVANEE
jgi:murein L,D-transpeptidase YafK